MMGQYFYQRIVLYPCKIQWQEYASILSKRFTLKIGCFMDLTSFPFDSQLCPILIESYAYRNYQIELMWGNNPIQINPKLSLAEFDLTQNDLTVKDNCTQNYVTGNFSCLEAYIILHRRQGK